MNFFFACRKFAKNCPGQSGSRRFALHRQFRRLSMPMRCSEQIQNNRPKNNRWFIDTAVKICYTTTITGM